MAVYRDGDKVFTIPAEKLAEIINWMNEHNKECGLPECYGGFTPTSKYTHTFRETGIGDNTKIVCDCGAEFYSAAGDENI